MVELEKCEWKLSKCVVEWMNKSECQSEQVNREQENKRKWTGKSRSVLKVTRRKTVTTQPDLALCPFFQLMWHTQQQLHIKEAHLCNPDGVFSFSSIWHSSVSSPRQYLLPSYAYATSLSFLLHAVNAFHLPNHPFQTHFSFSRSVR